MRGRNGRYKHLHVANDIYNLLLDYGDTPLDIIEYMKTPDYTCVVRMCDGESIFITHYEKIDELHIKAAGYRGSKKYNVSTSHTLPKKYRKRDFFKTCELLEEISRTGVR